MMYRQRGIADLWLIAIGLIAVLGLIAGISLTWTRYINGVDQKGYDRGYKEASVKFINRDNAALAAANARIAELNAAARAAEAEGQRKLAAIAQQREKDRANAQRTHDRDVADARSGALRLRDPGAVAACPAQGDRSAGAQAGAAAGNGNGQAGGELSRQLTEFLVTEADRADEIVTQLGACQDVIVADRKTINGGP